MAPPQYELFYNLCPERYIPGDHLLRRIDALLDFTKLRRHLQPFYSATGRPSVDPELLMRMLVIGYCYGIRSERRLCEEVHFNLAYRWFCRLGLDGGVPDYSRFSRNRQGRFRDSQLLRVLRRRRLRWRTAPPVPSHAPVFRGSRPARAWTRRVSPPPGRCRRPLPYRHMMVLARCSRAPHDAWKPRRS